MWLSSFGAKKNRTIETIIPFRWRRIRPCLCLRRLRVYTWGWVGPACASRLWLGFDVWVWLIVFSWTLNLSFTFMPHFWHFQTVHIKVGCFIFTWSTLWTWPHWLVSSAHFHGAPSIESFPVSPSLLFDADSLLLATLGIFRLLFVCVQVQPVRLCSFVCRLFLCVCALFQPFPCFSPLFAAATQHEPIWLSRLKQNVFYRPVDF